MQTQRRDLFAGLHPDLGGRGAGFCSSWSPGGLEPKPAQVGASSPSMNAQFGARASSVAAVRSGEGKPLLFHTHLLGEINEVILFFQRSVRF